MSVMGTVALSIKTGDDVRLEEVECRYAGKYFAVHRPHWAFDEDTWAITHRPSGYGAGRKFKTRRAAIEHAEWLEKRGKRIGIDWSASDPNKMARPKKKWKELHGGTIPPGDDRSMDRKVEKLADALQDLIG